MTILLKIAKALSHLGMISIPFLFMLLADSNAALAQKALALLPMLIALFLTLAILLTLKKKQSFPQLLANLFSAATLALFWFVLRSGETSLKTEYKVILALFLGLSLLMSLLEPKEFKRRRKETK